MANYDLERIADNFGTMIGTAYQSHLEYWRATAMDDMAELNEWQRRIDTETDVIIKNARDKILKIMSNPKEKSNKKYLKKEGFIFKKVNPHEFVITPQSGFYADLLPEYGDITYCFAANVHYEINCLAGIVVKVVDASANSTKRKS